MGEPSSLGELSSLGIKDMSIRFYMGISVSPSLRGVGFSMCSQKVFKIVTETVTFLWYHRCDN